MNVKKLRLPLLTFAVLTASVVLLCAVQPDTAAAGAPLLTQRAVGVVLSRTERELVLRTAENRAPVLRTLQVTDGAADKVCAGDTVRVEIQLAIDNTERLRSVEVLLAGDARVKDAQALPDILKRRAAFGAANEKPTE
ncbi:MAG: hypothetical protein RSC00_05575 [Ruthenibacterium sp.]